MYNPMHSDSEKLHFPTIRQVIPTIPPERMVRDQRDDRKRVDILWLDVCVTGGEDDFCSSESALAWVNEYQEHLFKVSGPTGSASYAAATIAVLVKPLEKFDPSLITTEEEVRDKLVLAGATVFERSDEVGGCCDSEELQRLLTISRPTEFPNKVRSGSHDSAVDESMFQRDLGPLPREADVYGRQAPQVQSRDEEEKRPGFGGTLQDMLKQYEKDHLELEY